MSPLRVRCKECKCVIYNGEFHIPRIVRRDTQPEWSRPVNLRDILDKVGWMCPNCGRELPNTPRGKDVEVIGVES